MFSNTKSYGSRDDGGEDQGKLSAADRESRLMENVSGLLETYIQLAKVELKEEMAEVAGNLKTRGGEEIEKIRQQAGLSAARWTGNIAVVSVAVFFLFFAFAFLAVGMALGLNALLGNAYAGFLLTGGFFLMLSAGVFMIRKKVKKYIFDRFIKEGELPVS